MSWHKASLSSEPVWIGWVVNLDCLAADMEPAKKQRLLALLRCVRSCNLCNVTMLQKLTGKLLWLSALLPALRPSLTPLYSDQYSGVLVACAVSESQWAALLSKLDRELRTTANVGLPSVPLVSKLVGVGGKSVLYLSDLPTSFPSCRLWIQVLCPHHSERRVFGESKLVLDLWLAHILSPSLAQCVRLAPLLACEAFADALLALLLRVLVVTSVSLLARPCSSSTCSRPRSSWIYAMGFLPLMCRSTLLPAGSSWPSWLWSGCFMACCRRRTLLSTFHSIVTTLLVILHPGRAFPWRVDYATSFRASVCANASGTSLFTLPCPWFS